jgi:hypothetical protein
VTLVIMSIYLDHIRRGGEEYTLEAHRWEEVMADVTLPQVRTTTCSTHSATVSLVIFYFLVLTTLLLHIYACGGHLTSVTLFRLKQGDASSDYVVTVVAMASDRYNASSTAQVAVRVGSSEIASGAELVLSAKVAAASGNRYGDGYGQGVFIHRTELYRCEAIERESEGDSGVRRWG